MRQVVPTRRANPFRYAIAASVTIKVLFLIGVLLWVPAPIKWPLALAVAIIAGVQANILRKGARRSR